MTTIMSGLLELIRSVPFIMALIAFSILCLYLGLTLPMMSLQIMASFPIIGEVELFQQTQSIWSSIVELFKKDYVLVAFLIFLFSVVVPVMKLICIAVVLMQKPSHFSARLHQFILLIGKWSMADVFVVSIFIAFLASSAKSDIQAQIHSGFYWFLSYCLISIAYGQLLKKDNS